MTGLVDSGIGNPRGNMKRAFIPLAFIIAVLAVGSVIGTVVRPGEWYAALNKPAFNPPNWVFAPVWSALYVMIGWAGSRVWVRDRTGPAFRFWLIQMVLNFIWTPVFFAAHRIDIALGILILLLGAIGAFMWTSRRVDRVAALLFLPYALWVSFAGVLNTALLVLN